MDAPISSGMVAFEGFHFDVDRRRLLHRDARGIWAPATVGLRALDVLAVVLRQPGVLVAKDAIMDQVWPSTAVEANNLTVQIAALRKILDAGRATGSRIQTVAGRGYRFVAPVTRLSDANVAELVPQSVRSPLPSARSAAPAQPGLSIPATHLVKPPQTLVEGVAEEPAGDALHEPRPVERGQMTVMAREVIEMAALSARLDPEGLRKVTTAWHRCCGDIIEQHSGSIANYATDGLLAWFGYPRASEDDAERAVQAGLALIDAVPKLTIDDCEPLQLNIRIATGLVVVGDEATTSGTRTITATGSTFRLADYSRALAGAGRVVIAESTRRLIGKNFELTELNQHQKTALGDPIHAWRAERIRVMQSRFDARSGSNALSPLVGRDEELDLLMRRWRQAKYGEGQVMMLSGEAGIGKSRVLNTLRQRLEAEGVQALRFQCSPHHVNSAFWPIIDNLERLLMFTRDETGDAKLDKLETLIGAHSRWRMCDSSHPSSRSPGRRATTR